jgi:thiamine pyrophosphokinase
MTLPSTLTTKTEWTFVGPMGPALPASLAVHPIIAVDGGAEHTDLIDIWVGDADSYTKEIKAPLIIRHPVEKDQSDLALALGLFEEALNYKLHFWGFLGGRKDHELFNLGEALHFLEWHQGSQVLIYGTDGKLEFHLLGEGHWKFTHHGTFSLGTVKKTSVKLKGECHYPILQSQILSPLTSFGLSNIGKGEMILETEGPVFVYYPEGK